MPEQTPTKNLQPQRCSENRITVHSILNESSPQRSGERLPKASCIEKDEWPDGQASYAGGLETTGGSGFSTDDIHFIVNTELLQVTPDHFKPRILNALTKVKFPTGHRILNQGGSGDRLFSLPRHHLHQWG
jgi:hypothetical protein